LQKFQLIPSKVPSTVSAKFSLQQKLKFSIVSYCTLLCKHSYWFPYTDCYPTAPRLLCGWSDGLEWSSGCCVLRQWPTL